VSLLSRVPLPRAQSWWSWVGAAVVLLGGLIVVADPLTGSGVLVALGAVMICLVVGVVGVSRRDAASLLILLVLLLFLVPEKYVLAGPLKSVGNPAQLIGTVCLLLWVAMRILGRLNVERGHPVRWAFLIFALATATAFAAGTVRILTDDEAAGSVRSLFPVLALLGIGLLAVDGLVDESRLEKLLLVLVVSAGSAAAIGILEFVAPSFHYADVAHLPGLVTNSDVVIDSRSGFNRIDGAAAHPIEYAVALAAIAPLALHFSVRGRTPTRRNLAKLSLAAILLVNPMSVSRSGLLALGIGLGFYVVQLNPRAKLNALVLGIVGLVLFRAAIPGLLGTMKSLFLVGDDDPSIAGRTQDYAKIPGLMESHWLIGRGLGTFQPLTYFFLDNQYLGSLLEAGLFGLGALIAVFFIGMGVARGARKRSTSAAGRGLGQALAGSIAALAAAGATFDELSFHQTGFLIFLLVGAAGAYWTSRRTAPMRARLFSPRETPVEKVPEFATGHRERPSASQ
jgi:hypothetical protein